MRPSDAAKMWVASAGNPSVVSAGGTTTTLDEYRRQLRQALNKYSHVSYELCAWDLFFQPRRTHGDGTGSSGTLEINHQRQVIDANGHAIDAYITATPLECLTVIREAYSKALECFDMERELDALVPAIEQIMRDHSAHGCHDVTTPAEIRRLRS
jgi:hypothetical protein